MTLRDILTKETHDRFGDMDVTNDVIDRMFPAWCGQTCTEEGEKEFGEILSCPAHINGGTLYGSPYGVIVVEVDGPNWKRLYNKAEDFFGAMCGYCTEEEYDRWFKEEDEEPVDDGKETNAGYEILRKMSVSSCGQEEGYVLGFMNKSTGPEWVTWGFTKRTNEEPSYYWGHYFTDCESAKKDLFSRMNGMLCSLEDKETDADILDEYLERTGATMYKCGGAWVLVEEGYSEPSFVTWPDMIEYMKEQNELMRG